ncbi:MAG: PhoX family protein [Alphaproteobacteria bacterium]
MDFEDKDGAAALAPIRTLISRRMALMGLGAAFLAPALGGCVADFGEGPGSAASPGGVFDFAALRSEVIDTHAVPDNYEAEVLIRWGDRLRARGPAFVPGRLSAREQRAQFGFNCDYVAFLPAPAARGRPARGVLVVNHEYASYTEMLAPGVKVPPPSAATVAMEQAAIGLSVVGLVRRDGKWQVDLSSRLSRRISVTTPMVVSGPAAGDPRLRTRQDSSGRRVRGTLANCAGGKTPWGTVLSAEENFHAYFTGRVPEGHRETDALQVAQAGYTAAELQTISQGGSVRRAAWAKHDPRFDVSVEPTEPNRFGWMIEVDPFSPASMPVKRTALGRFRHEAATPIVNVDGRVVAYLGEDRSWGFVYRYVSKGVFDPAAGTANGRLLDEGTLSVARFDEEGVTWVPLVHGQSGLTEANGFSSQADVVIDARRAAQVAGGTPMDRPEDIDVSPLTGHVFVNLTRNTERKEAHVDPANPRADNEDGHILELVPPGAGGKVDHAADRFAWTVFLLAGPLEGNTASAGGVSALSGPDNLAFDPQGRLWIATDNRRWSEAKPIPNGLYACAVDGSLRAKPRLFVNVPRASEATGPEFTPDGETLFLAVQHPGQGLDPKPARGWPDFKEGVPGRPSVIMVRRRGGGPIGGVRKR